MTRWALELRRDGVLLSDGTSDVLLEARSAALLTYLAVEGQTSRRALAALLWPDSQPRAARANLRKLLSRLGAWRGVLDGPDPVRLRADLRTSPWDLLPETLDIDDSTPFAAWLEEARERRRRDRVDWLRGEIAQHESAGRGRDALASAEELLSLEPSEPAARAALALAGRLDLVDEGLALYRRHAQRLLRTVGAEPEAATQALARDLGRCGDEPLARLIKEGARLHGAEAANALAHIDATRPAWIAAWERAVTDRDAGSLSRAANALSDYLEIRGDVRLAVRLLAQAVAVLEASDAPSDQRAAGRLLVQLAWHEQRLGLPTAGAHAELGLALLRPDADAAHHAQALYASGRALWARGDVTGARERWNRAHAHLEGAQDGLRAAYLHTNVAMAADALGEPVVAARHYRSALDRFRRHGAEGAATACLNNLGQLLVESGDVAEGTRLLDRGIELARALDQRMTLAYLLDSRCRAALASSDTDRARMFLDEAVQLERSGSDRVLSASVRASEASLALAVNDGGLSKALKALAAAWELRLRPATLDALLLIARALRALGAETDADRILSTLATEEGSAAASARELLGDRDTETAGDVDALVSALVGS